MTTLTAILSGTISRDRLDAIALNERGRVELAKPLTDGQKLPNRSFDYRFRQLVFTNGTVIAAGPPRGRVILLGITHRSSDLIIQGRILHMRKKFPSLSYTDAEKIDKIRSEVKFGFEDEVEDVVLTAFCNGYLGRFAEAPPFGEQFHKWYKEIEWCLAGIEISKPRIVQVCHIARLMLAPSSGIACR